VSATGTGDDILTFTPATGTCNLGSIDRLRLHERRWRAVLIPGRRLQISGA